MPLTMHPTESMADEELARSAQAGNPEALDALVDRFYGPVHALAARLLGHPAEARDAAQEAFLRAIASLSTFRPDRPFSSWIFTIAANLIRDRQRRKRPEMFTAAIEDSLSISMPPDVPLETEEDKARVREAVESLPFDIKMVIVLHFQQGCDYPQIAEMLRITVNAVRIRLYRGLTELRVRLKEKRT